MRRSPHCNQQNGNPVADVPQRLGQQYRQREKRNNQHRPHAARIGVHPPVDKVSGELAAEDRTGYRDRIEHGDRPRDLRAGHIVLRLEVGRSPEQEKPPNAVGQEFSHRKSPSLPVVQTLPNRHLIRNGLFSGHLRRHTCPFIYHRYPHYADRCTTVRRLGRYRARPGFQYLILFDISAFGRIHPGVVFGAFIDELPETQPNEADRTDYEECGLPTPHLGHYRHGQRCENRTYISTRIENAGSESPVFFGKILGGRLDCRWEITRFAQSQHATANDESRNTHHRDL